jgi:hypothetical protein
MNTMTARTRYEESLDATIDTTELVPIAARTGMKAQPSQRPGPEMMWGCVVGNKEAQAVRDCWRFNHPVTVVSREKFAAMIERQSGQVFIG